MVFPEVFSPEPMLPLRSPRQWLESCSSFSSGNSEPGDTSRIPAEPVDWAWLASWSGPLLHGLLLGRFVHEWVIAQERPVRKQASLSEIEGNCAIRPALDGLLGQIAPVRAASALRQVSAVLAIVRRSLPHHACLGSQVPVTSALAQAVACWQWLPTPQQWVGSMYWTLLWREAGRTKHEGLAPRVIPDTLRRNAWVTETDLEYFQYQRVLPVCG